MSKICHVTSVHNRYDIRILKKECCSLVQAGYDVYLLCIDDKDDEIYDGVNIVSVNAKFKNRMQRIFKSWKVLIKQALQIDAEIYHLHDPELFKLGLQLKKRGKKVVFDSHEDVPAQVLAKTYIPKIFRKILSYVVKIKQDRILKKYSGVVAATDYILEKLKSCNSNIVTVNNYPLIDEFVGLENKQLDKEDLVCYVGGITEQRGIYNIIKTADMCSCKFAVGGECDPFLKKELSQLQGYSKVDFLGYLKRNELKDLYARSKVGICVLKKTPNHLFSNPIKLFEYMAAGIPVICSNFSHWENIVAGNKCGICVDPNDASSMAVAIDLLINNQDIAQEMGNNGRQAVVTKFNWENQVQALLCFYKNILVYRGES